MVILSTKDSFSNCLSGNQNKDCKSNLLTLTRYHTPLVTTATHNNRIKHLISKEIKVVECETWRVFHDYQISRTSSTGSSWKNMHKFLQWSLNSWRGFRCPTERIPLAAGSVVAPGNWRQTIPASKKTKQTNQTKLQTNKQNLHFCSCGSCPVTGFSHTFAGSIFTYTVTGTDRTRCDTLGKKHPAGHKTWDHHGQKRCQTARQQPHSSSQPGFSSPYPPNDLA